MLLATLALAGALEIATVDDAVYEIDDTKITLNLESLRLPRERDVPLTDQLRGAWKGKLGRNRLTIDFRVYFRRALPEQVIQLITDDFNAKLEDTDRTSTKSNRWQFDEQRFESGSYGYVPYTIIGTKLEEGEKPFHYFCMAGVTETHGYSVEVFANKALDDAAKKEVVQFLLDNVSYGGPVQVKEWTKEEVKARWLKDAPEGLEKKLEEHRTEHFLILTNSSGKKKFAAELEKAYDRIREVYPFEERAEHRLLPIFLFRTPDQYYDFCEKTLDWSREEAKASGGVAYGDFYATWYESPKDPVHIHEVTHQLFRNRLFLSGGGSWFQEGVAEYMSTSKNDRKEFKRLAKKEKHVPFCQFFSTRSLLGSNPEERVDGTDPASEAYLQAACITEFVRESRDFGSKFQDYVHRLGEVPRRDLVRIEGALRESLGVGIDEFEERFLEYWKKRK